MRVARFLVIQCTVLLVSLLFSLPALTPSMAYVPSGTIGARDALSFMNLSPKEAPGAQERNNWFIVPDWLGGTWQATSQTIVEAYDDRQQLSVIDGPVELAINRISIIGMQRDNRGRIWHFAGTPYNRTVSTDSADVYQQIQQVDLIKSDATEVAVNCVADVTRVKKQANELIDSFIEQTVTSYTPLKDDLIRVTFDIIDYDLSGKRLSSSRDISIEKRIKPFQVIDKDARGNLLLKFLQYRKGNGLDAPL